MHQYIIVGIRWLSWASQILYAIIVTTTLEASQLHFLMGFANIIGGIEKTLGVR